jgi:hypothetical protein
VPGDGRFSPVDEAGHCTSRYRSKPYVSKGLFKDF